MNSNPNCLIIGAGPAGLAAAEMLSGLGAKVCLVDDNAAPGGQYLRRPAKGSGSIEKRPEERLRLQGFKLIDKLNAAGIEILSGQEVIGLTGDRRVILAEGRGRLREIFLGTVIIAAGARERFIPFPGWTLPGIISTGAAQIMLKSQNILPDKEMVVAGAGPLPLIMAHQASRAGGRIKALIDLTPLGDQAAALGLLLQKPEKLATGLAANLALKLKGTKIIRRAAVIRAEGQGRLERLILAKLDDRGRPVPGKEKIIETSCLAIGHGLTPNLELPLAAGCRMDNQPGLGGWVPVVDERLQTSVPGIFAAGETCGPGGADKAFLEGRLAGLGAAGFLSLAGEDQMQALGAPLARLRKKELAFAAWLNKTCQPPAGLWENIPDETIICRCEDITMLDLRRAVAKGHTSLAGIKRATRTGMGYCQGRTCAHLATDIIQALSQTKAADIGPVSARFPLKPIRLGELAALAGQDRVGPTGP